MTEAYSLEFARFAVLRMVAKGLLPNGVQCSIGEYNHAPATVVRVPYLPGVELVYYKEGQWVLHMGGEQGALYPSPRDEAVEQLHQCAAHLRVTLGVSAGGAMEGSQV